MEKPFDRKDLEARLKAKGLEKVEGLAETVAIEVLAWAEESCNIHPNLLVKSVGAPAVGIIKPILMGQIDKIDGVEG